MQQTPSTRGPQALVVLGVLLVLGAVAVAVLGSVAFTRALPVDVLDGAGGPGSAVVAVVEAGETVEADLAAGDHQVWLAAPRSDDVGLDGDIRVIGPDGEEVAVRPGWLSGTVGREQVVARTVASFDVATSGTHHIDAPLVDGTADAHLLITPDDGAVAFVGGILGTIGAVLGGLVLGVTGVGLAAGGGIWWYRRLHPPTA